MDNSKIITVVIILFLTLLSGFGDSKGFVHAANIWHNGKIIWSELGKSALGFGIGIGTYWVVIKYLKEFGINSPEIQTIGWFIVTIIGVAVLSGKFSHWERIDQIVGIALVAGFSFLLFRTGS